MIAVLGATLALALGLWVGARLGRAEVLAELRRRTPRIVPREPETDAIQRALLRRRLP